MTPAARLSPEQRERITNMLIYADSYVAGFAEDAAWIWSNMGGRVGLISKAWGYALDADALRALLAATEPPPTPTVEQLRSIEWSGRNDGYLRCPACYGDTSGHEPDCWLAACLTTEPPR